MTACRWWTHDVRDRSKKPDPCERPGTEPVVLPGGTLVLLCAEHHHLYGMAYGSDRC